MWISFGPIHYNNPKLEVSEKCKLQLVAKFIRDSGYSSHEVLYEEIKSDIIGLEQCYDEKVIRGFTHKETLYWILFFDGCAILQFLASSSSTDALKELKELKIKIDQETFINCDLLLLENQIPFRLLELLMDKSKIKDKLPELLNKFIRRNVMAPVKYQKEIFKAETKTNPAHLLDLFRLAFLQHPAAPDHQTNNAGETTRQPADDPDISSTSGSSNVTQPAHDPYISSTSGSAHDRRDCCELIIYSLKKYLLLPISWQNRARRTQSAAPVRRFHDEETQTTQQPGRLSDDLISFNDEQMRVVSQSAAPVRNDINAEETTQQPGMSFYR